MNVTTKHCFKFFFINVKNYAFIDKISTVKSQVIIFVRLHYHRIKN